MLFYFCVTIYHLYLFGSEVYVHHPKGIHGWALSFPYLSLDEFK